MEEATVKAIVEEWLEDSEFDGLYNEAGCGCLLEDLAPCDEMSQHCEAAYRFECQRCAKRSTCDLAEDDQPWLMAPNKGFCKPVYASDAPAAACASMNAALPACAPMTVGEAVFGVDHTSAQECAQGAPQYTAGGIFNSVDEGVMVEAGEWIIPLSMAEKLFPGGSAKYGEAVYEIDQARSDHEAAVVKKMVCQNTAKTDEETTWYPDVETALRHVRKGLLQLGA